MQKENQPYKIEPASRLSLVSEPETERSGTDERRRKECHQLRNRKP